MKSIIFVVIQFTCLGLIVLTGPIFPGNVLLLAVEAIGVGLGLWAVLVMGIGNFHIAPDPLRRSRLVKRGPYRLIRHPMYLALLIATLPLILAEFSPLRLIVWLILLVNLVLKLKYEENLLADKLEGYRQYQAESYRLIPYIY